MKMFKTCNDRIEEVEVTRVTEKSVFLSSRFHKNVERRQERLNGYESFFETWEEARSYLVKKKKREIENHETTLRTLNNELDKLLNMEEKKV